MNKSGQSGFENDCSNFQVMVLPILVTVTPHAGIFKLKGNNNPGSYQNFGPQKGISYELGAQTHF